MVKTTDSLTNSRRDNPHVPTKLKPVNDEFDDSVNVPTSETEVRLYGSPRKKPTTYTKPTGKITPKSYYDQSTYTNYIPTKDNPKKSESKYPSNSPYDEEDYVSPNFQSNYYNYQTSRPSETAPNRQSSEVIFRPRPSQQSTKPTNRPKPTRPWNNGNSGSSDTIHFPDENNHESSNVNYPNGNNQQNGGQYESNQYPAQNGNHGSNAQRPNQSARPDNENGNTNWGSSSNSRPTGQNSRPNNNNDNNNNRPNNRPTTEEVSWGNTPRGTSRPQQQLLRISEMSKLLMLLMVLLSFYMNSTVIVVPFLVTLLLDYRANCERSRDHPLL